LSTTQINASEVKEKDAEATEAANFARDDDNSLGISLPAQGEPVIGDSKDKDETWTIKQVFNEPAKASSRGVYDFLS